MYYCYMKIILSNRTRTILIHTFFWIVAWFLFVYFLSYNSDDRNYIIRFSTLILPVTISVTYFMVNFLIPKYLLAKKYFQFILYSFYTFVASAYIIVHIIFVSFLFLSEYNIYKMPPMSKNIVFILIIVYLFVGIVSFVSLLNNNFQTLSRNKELQNGLYLVPNQQTHRIVKRRGNAHKRVYRPRKNQVSGYIKD